MSKFWKDNLICSFIICVLGLIGFGLITIIAGCNFEKFDPNDGKLYEDGTYGPNNELKVGLKYKEVYKASLAGELFRIEFDGHIYIIRSQGNQGGICHDPDCPCIKKQLERKD